MHVPTLFGVTVVPETEQMPDVLLVSVTASPDDAVALTVNVGRY